MQQEQLLLDAIREDPDDRANYAVYGDWLAQRGDPRGELIGLSLALERDPEPTLAKRVQRLIAQQAKALPPRLPVTWKLGFVSEIRLDPAKHALDVLGHPLLQLVDTVSLVDRRMWFRRRTRRPIYAPLVARVIELAPRATLRRFEIGDAASPVFAAIGELQQLLAHFPRLTELAIHADELPAGLVEVLAPATRALELASPAVDDTLMDAIANASWPQLRSLALHFPRRAQQSAAPLDPMMRHGFPALVDLRVHEHDRAGAFTEEFCLAIVKSPLLARLEVLDFTVRDLDVDIVRPSHPQLRHLKRFLPSAEEETDIETLEQLTYLLEEPDTHRAIHLTRRVRELATTQFDLHNINRRLGTALSLIGELDEALAALDESLANEPSCGVTLHHKAWTLKRLGRLEEAAVVLTAGEETSRHPQSRCSTLYLRQSLEIAGGAPPDVAVLAEARRLFEETLTTRVVDADLHYELACTCNLMGDPAAAVRTLVTTFELCPYYKAWARTEIDFVNLRDKVAFRVLVEE